MGSGISVVSALIFLGALQAVILFAALLSPGRRRKSPANRVLAALMLLTALRLFHVGASFTGPGRGPALSLGWTLFLIYTFPPLLFLYVKALTTPRFSFRQRQALHFLPPAAAFGLMLLSTWADFVGEAGGGAGVFSWTWTSFLESPWPDILWLVQTVIYLRLIARLTRSHAAQSTLVLSDEERVRLRWIRQLAAAFLALCALEVFFLGSLAFGWPIVRPSVVVLYLAVAAIVCLWGYFGLRQPEIFSPANGVEPAAPVPAPAVQPARRPGLAERLGEHMTGTRQYLDPGLTIYDLARALDVPVYQLSAVLNQDLGRTFFDYVNGFRVEEAKRRLADPGLESRKILAIALDCGFASKSAFNRVFKETTGEVPSAFRAKRRPISPK